MLVWWRRQDGVTGFLLLFLFLLLLLLLDVITTRGVESFAAFGRGSIEYSWIL